MRWPGWDESHDADSSRWLVETPMRRMLAGLAFAAMGAGIIAYWQLDPQDFWDGRRPLVALITAPALLAFGLYFFTRNLVTWLRGDDLRDDTSLIDPPV